MPTVKACADLEVEMEGVGQDIRTAAGRKVDWDHRNESAEQR